MLAFVTDFADQAVVLPVAVMALACLVISGWRRGALAWVVCIGATLGATLALKLLTMACGIPGLAGLQSPSGHSAGATAVYGGLAGLLLRRRLPGVLVAGAAAALVAAVVGATRVGLGMHTLADVCAGGAVGLAGACSMRAWAGTRPAVLPVGRMASAVLAAMLLFHGQRLDAEPRLRWAAARIWPLSLCRPDASPSP
jgi:membrane-associated phospholipid phosphatase